MKLADEKRTLKQSKNVSAQKEQQYKDLWKKVKKSARQDKERWIQQQCEEIEKGLVIGKTRHAYSLIKMLRRKFTPRINVIQDQDGKYYSLKMKSFGNGRSTVVVYIRTMEEAIAWQETSK